MASPVRLALAPAAKAGPGTVRQPRAEALAGGTVSATPPMASATALTLMADGHER
jgi:hypothetical protein